MVAMRSRIAADLSEHDKPAVIGALVDGAVAGAAYAQLAAYAFGQASSCPPP